MMSDPHLSTASLSDPNPSAVTAADEVRCINCEYALRGLPEQGACPECGMPVARSLHDRLLRHANPIWLQTVVGGLNWVLMAGALLALTNRLSRYWYDPVFAWWDVLWRNARPMSLPQILLCVATVLGTAGFWRATLQEPAMVREGFSRRVLLRWSCFIAAGLYLLLVRMEMRSPTSGLTTPMALSYLFLVGVLNTIQAICCTLFLRDLAFRIPAGRIAWWLGLAGAIMGITLLAHNITKALLWIIVERGSSYETWERISRAADSAEMSTLAAGTFAFFVALFLCVALNRCVRQAKEGWAPPPMEDSPVESPH